MCNLGSSLSGQHQSFSLSVAWGPVKVIQHQATVRLIVRVVLTTQTGPQSTIRLTGRVVLTTQTGPQATIRLIVRVVLTTQTGPQPKIRLTGIVVDHSDWTPSYN